MLGQVEEINGMVIILKTKKQERKKRKKLAQTKTTTINKNKQTNIKPKIVATLLDRKKIVCCDRIRKDLDTTMGTE